MPEGLVPLGGGAGLEPRDIHAVGSILVVPLGGIMRETAAIPIRRQSVDIAPLVHFRVAIRKGKTGRAIVKVGGEINQPSGGVAALTINCEATVVDTVGVLLDEQP